jgi:hypothetical protein
MNEHIDTLNTELKLLIDALKFYDLDPYWHNSGGGIQVLVVESPSLPDYVSHQWLVAGEDDYASDEWINVVPIISYMDQNLWNDSSNIWIDSYMPHELPETLTEPHHLKQYAKLIKEFFDREVSTQYGSLTRPIEEPRNHFEADGKSGYWSTGRSGQPIFYRD